MAKLSSTPSRIQDLFGIHSQASIRTFVNDGNPNIPKVNDLFVFRHDFVQTMLAFLQAPHGDALWVQGPTGSGKTEGVLQIAARLNWPVSVVNCSGSTDLEEEIGIITMQVENGQTKSVFQEGAFLQAVRQGRIMLFNEFDLLKPQQAAIVNDIVEGRPLRVRANGGEQVRPHPNFRLIVTANSNGCGDRTGLYRGVVQQNLATLDRFRCVRVDYPTPDIEEVILDKASHHQLPRDTIKKMVHLANEVRHAFTGDGITEGTLAKTISTRVLCRWAIRVVESFGKPAGLYSSCLEESCTLLANPEDREAINEMGKTIFGESNW